ncbi:hypothetical protein M0804_012835 [Polistes exclamans]|nr:hypothetical protein M0804_012835 [Polistes exclamans]
MPSDDPLRNEPLVSVEFEVFGKVQGILALFVLSVYRGWTIQTCTQESNSTAKNNLEALEGAMMTQCVQTSRTRATMTRHSGYQQWEVQEVKLTIANLHCGSMLRDVVIKVLLYAFELKYTILFIYFCMP